MLKNKCDFSAEITDDELLQYREFIVSILYENFLKKYSDFLTKLKNRLYRFHLVHEISTANTGNMLTVIAMNPSHADSDHLDSTLKNLEKYILSNKLEYSSFEIYNLFPIRWSESETLLKVLKYDQSGKYQKKNQEIISSCIKETSNDILLAWGKEYHDYAKKTLWWDLLKTKENLFVYAPLNKGNFSPRSLSPQAYIQKGKYDKLHRVSIDKSKNELKLVE